MTRIFVSQIALSRDVSLHSLTRTSPFIVTGLSTAQ